MFSRIINKLKYKLLLSKIKPEIIGYRDFKGKIISNTGSSNMTHISNKKNVKIGDNVFIGHFNYIDGFKNVSIGDGCQITNYVSILTHSTHHNCRFNVLEKDDKIDILLLEGTVSIGKHCYVGPHSTIMPGTKLGKGCIVSAYSYVNGNFPDYSIVRGQPARIIGSTKEMDDAFLKDNPEFHKNYYDSIK